MKKIVTFAMAAAVLAGAFTATTIATADKAEAEACVKIKPLGPFGPSIQTGSCK